MHCLIDLRFLKVCPPPLGSHVIYGQDLHEDQLTDYPADHPEIEITHLISNATAHLLYLFVFLFIIKSLQQSKHWPPWLI